MVRCFCSHYIFPYKHVYYTEAWASLHCPGLLMLKNLIMSRIKAERWERYSFSSFPPQVENVHQLNLFKDIQTVNTLQETQM